MSRIVSSGAAPAPAPVVRPPVQVSSSSSLDSFLIDLPAASVSDVLALHMNTNGFENDDMTDESHKVDTSELFRAPVEVTSAALAPALYEPPLGRGGLHAAMLPQSHGTMVSVAAASVVTNSVPEFLYQLTKMLTDNNKDVIEWSNGRIEVHSPQKLESHVLKKYFRHSKFASFQRQLNYFGFRKLAGKGKMAPCSYINEAAMDDIRSLFHIKRKSGTDPQENPSKKKRDVTGAVKAPGTAAAKDSTPLVSSLFAGDVNLTARYQKKQNPAAVATSIVRVTPAPMAANSTVTAGTAISAHQALAQRAVGRGIRHGFAAPQPLGVSSSTARPPAVAATTTNLSELTQAYQSSLNEASTDVLGSDDDPTPLSQMQNSGDNYDNSDPFMGFLSRSSSLIDLAMIAPVDEALEEPSSAMTDSARGFGFVDFPYVEVDPSALNNGNSEVKHE